MADESASSSRQTQLATYVKQVFDNFQTNRQEIEQKWDKNWENFKGVATDIWKSGEAKDWRSDTFIQVTKAKVMTAYAIVIDLILKGGEVPHELKLSNWQGQDIDTLPPEVKKELERRCEAVATRISGQLSAGKADRALSKNILSAAIFGETYAKITVRPYTEATWQMANPEDLTPDEVAALPEDAQVWKKIATHQKGPSWNFVPVWDVFRDLEVEDPREGHAVIHRQFRSARWLRTRMKHPLFIPSAIRRVLARQKNVTITTQGGQQIPEADTSSMSPSQRYITNRINTNMILEYWGLVDRATVEAFEEMLASEAKLEGPENVPVPEVPREVDYQAGDEIECMVMVCDGEVIRFARTTPEDRPIFRAVWEESLHEGEAFGVADNVADLQLVINGGFRALEDNNKLSGNVILGVLENRVKNLKDRIEPGMMLKLKEGVRNINEVLSAFQIPNVGASMIPMIEMCLNLADNDSLIPRISMGLSDQSRDATAYEISTQVASSTKYIGAVVRRFDEQLIEPIIGFYYDYAMQDTDFPDKVPLMIEATGFQSYHDRLLVFDQLQRMLQIFMSNPIMAVNTRVRAIQEDIAKALGQKPDLVLRSEEEAKQMMTAMNTSPIQLAQQAKAEAEAKKSSAAAMKLMQDIKASQEKVKIDRALAAQSIRNGAKANNKPEESEESAETEDSD